MKRRGVTLVELIVVLGLIAIILPLTYSIYFNGIKLSNYISDDINAQADGRSAINQINLDLRLAKYTSDNYNQDVNENFDAVNKVINGSDGINGNAPMVYESKYYIESLSSTEPFIYATTKPDDKGDVSVYKLYLKDNGDNGKSINIYSVGDIKAANDATVASDFSLESITNMDKFEEFALYNAAKPSLETNRNKIEINSDPIVDSHYIIMGCFIYNFKTYVYFMHDITGEKFYGVLQSYTKPVHDYVVDSDRLIIKNVHDFKIMHSGITFNIKFECRINNNPYYPFNVDVNPIYLGGGD
jgi:prepilin-type N-terminal cleavage/methylation domain-containing protein